MRTAHRLAGAAFLAAPFAASLSRMRSRSRASISAPPPATICRRTPRSRRSAPGLAPRTCIWRKHGGINGLGSIGYGFGNGLRLEVEGDFFRNKMAQAGPHAVPHRCQRPCQPLWRHGQRAVRPRYRRPVHLPVSRRRRRLYVDPPERQLHRARWPVPVQHRRTEGRFACRASPACRSRSRTCRPVDHRRLSLHRRHRGGEILRHETTARQPAPDGSSSVRSTTTASCSASATPSTSPPPAAPSRRRRSPPRPRRRPAPIWCSSTGTRRR